MKETRYYCDGCRKEVPNADCLKPLELPCAYEDCIKVNGVGTFKSHKVKLKYYEFCEDCYNKIGSFMSMFENNEWTFDDMIDGVLKVAKDMLEKENNNVN